MPEHAVRKSALADVVRPGRFGVREGVAPGVTFDVRPPRCLVQVAADQAAYRTFADHVRAATGLQLPQHPNMAATADELTALWVSPERAFVLAPATRPLFDELEALTAGGAVAITDLSHSRVCIGIAGPHARDVLAAGAGLDFHPRKFNVGQCQQSNYGRIACLFHAIDATPTFDMYCYRGFAESLWHLLTTEASQYSFSVQIEAGLMA